MTASAGLWRRFEPYAALVRVPNVFTAPPDVVLGAALVAAAGSAVEPVRVAGIAIASMALYAGGTTLNDAFDAPVDEVERPERPIPSGRVGRRNGFLLGAAFLTVGVLLAALAANAGAVAAVLAIVIVLYDGVLKGRAVGFLAMGATRGLNVLLGTTAAGGLTALSSPSKAVPVIIALYIAAVTYMAAREAEGGNRGAVAVAALGAVGAALGVVGYLVATRATTLQVIVGTGLAVAFLVWTGRALRRAYADPVPEIVGPTVGVCVLGLVVLDAAFAAAAGPLWAIVAIAFLGPAWGLSRVFDVS